MSVSPPAEAMSSTAHASPAAGETARTPSEAPPATSAAELTAESVVEALLFATDTPLSASKLAHLLGLGDAGDVKDHIARLNARYEQVGAAFRVEAIAEGFQMLTLPAYAPYLARLHKARAESRLSTAALETLAIIAYKQPVLRADVEAIRGVAVGDLLVRLREMNLVRIVGRAEEIGRPLLYGTTKKFLEVFGLRSLKDLPRVDELTTENVPKLALAQPRPSAPEATPADAE